MPTFNKIQEQCYSTLASVVMNADNSINVEYAICIGSTVEGELTDIQVVAKEYKYINPIEAQALQNQPLTADDVGKSPTDILHSRIHKHLLDTKQVLF